MTEEERFLDFATVREMLYDAQERRGALKYEQKWALQHAEWAASEARNGISTLPEVFEELRSKLLEVETCAKHPDLAAKLAELMPAAPEDVRAVFGSKRIKIEDSEIDAVLDVVRQVI
ncbi:MAG: hypothetical protein O3C36_00390 [archaeon]|jgi:DNA-directed RNA polymerase subunit F|nr:hypothetical protein [archaeon]